MTTYTALIRPGGELEEDLTPRRLSRALAAEPRAVGWLDLEDPPAEEGRALEVAFGFHPLALEGATNPETRPKVEGLRLSLSLALFVYFRRRHWF